MKLARIPCTSCPMCKGGLFGAAFDVDCTVCPHYDPIMPERMVWMRCWACEHLFVSGYYSDEDNLKLIEAAHRTRQPNADGNWLANFDNGRRYEGLRIIDDLIAMMRGAPCNMLEVGPGDGAVVLAAIERGLSVTIIEHNQELRSRLLALRKVSFQPRVEEPSWVGNFDIVVMGDVLEHIAFPMCTLDAIADLQRADGVLYLSTPNRDSPKWGAMVEARTNPYLYEVEHLHCFSLASIELALQKRGYRVEHVKASRYLCGVEVFAVKCR